MNKLDGLFKNAPSPADYARAYAEHLCALLKNLDTGAVQQLIEIFLAARESGNHIFFCGNGGSAATASHFANDISIGTRTLNKPFRALALTDNVAVMTAIANDDGYEDIFVQQLQALMMPGDVVVAISASGNSGNAIKALDYANENEGHSVALTGFDGGRMKQLAKTVVHIDTGKGEYGPVEDMHMILDHIIGSYLMRAVRDYPG